MTGAVLGRVTLAASETLLTQSRHVPERPVHEWRFPTKSAPVTETVSDTDSLGTHSPLILSLVVARPMVPLRPRPGRHHDPPSIRVQASRQ